MVLSVQLSAAGERRLSRAALQRMLCSSGVLFLRCFSRFPFHWYFLCLCFQDIDINTDDELDAYIEDLITKGD